MSGRKRVQAGNPGRPLSRAERAAVWTNTEAMPQNTRTGMRMLAETAPGRARLRDGQLTVPRRPEPVRPAPGQRYQLAGVDVDMNVVLANLRKSTRGRAQLRSRGLE